MNLAAAANNGKGSVYVNNYYDAETQQSVSPDSKFDPVTYSRIPDGTSGLGSEYGTILGSNTIGVFGHYVGTEKQMEADIDLSKTVQQYGFRFTYGNGDYYDGYGHTDLGTYVQNQTWTILDENGQTGTYKINYVTLASAANNGKGKVYVWNYYDSETGQNVYPDYGAAPDGAKGQAGLGSEHGTIFGNTTVGAFGYDAQIGKQLEADVFLNVPPVAVGDAAIVDEDGSVEVSVLANDSDHNNDSLSIIGISSPSHGTAVLGADGVVTYSPFTDYFGSDSFGYTIDDGHGGTANATVSVTVKPVPEIFSLSGDFVESGVAGYIVGAVSVNDPNDPAPIIILSDNRFEIFNGELKLKADQALLAETNAVVPLILTASDALGSHYVSQFQIGVGHTLIGTDAGEIMDGSVGLDRIFGLGGDDTLNGSFGNDLLEGGAGNDDLYGGAGAGHLIGGTGNDSLIGGDYRFSSGSSDDLLEGGDGNDQLYDYGGTGSRLLGGAGNDTLEGNGTLDGGDGNDTLYGSGILIGGAGDDTLSGSGLLQGGDGNDGLTANQTNGTNSLYGGAGDDRLTWNWSGSQTSVDTLTGGPGRDTFVLGAYSYDTSSAGYVPDRITDFTSGADGDVLDYSALLGLLANYDGGNPFASGHLRLVQDGSDTLLQMDVNGGGDAFITVLIGSNLNAASLTLDNSYPDFSPSGIDGPGVTLDGTDAADTLNGTARDDFLYGLGGDDTLNGSFGNDLLDGGTGNDTLNGGYGNDLLEGGAGNDDLDGGAGADHLIGGTGNDSLYGGDNSYSSGSSDDLLEGGDGNDQLYDYGGTGSQLLGGAGDDILQGNGTLDGGDGKDQLYGTGTLIGGTSDDTLSGSGNLQGGDGNDSLSVNQTGGENSLDGGAGNDRLTWNWSGSQTSVDTLTGGPGRDTFVLSAYSYNSPSAGYVPDRITDFTSGADGDVLDYSSLIGLLTNYSGGNPFAQGFLHFERSGSDVLFQMDANGGGDYYSTVLTLSDVRASVLAPANLNPGFDPMILIVNEAPLAVDDSANLDEDTSVTITVLANDSDPDGDPLTVAGIATPGHGTAVLGSSGAINYTPVANYFGSDSFSYTISDGHGHIDIGTVSITVNPVNDPPVVVHPLTNQTAHEGEDFSFQIPQLTFLDIDSGDTFGYTANLADGSALPAWLHLDTATGIFSGKPAKNDAGQLNVRVSATDTHGGSVSDDFVINVLWLNHPPTLSHPIPDQATNEQASFSFTLPTGTFTDSDRGDVLVYSGTLADGSPLPNWLHWNAGTGQFSGTPFDGDTGSLAIRVNATDTQGASASDEFSLVVANLNFAPTNILLSGQTIAENSPGGTLVGTFSAVDPDAGDTHVFRLLGDAGGRFVLDGDRLLVADGAVLDYEQNHALSVTVEARDAGGLSYSQGLNINLLNVSEPPTIIQLDHSIVEENSPAGTPVGRLTTNDENPSALNTYTLLDNADGRFVMSGNQLLTRLRLRPTR